MTQADDGASEAAKPVDLEGALTNADVEWRALAADDREFLVGGVRPSYVCTPANTEELAGVMRAAEATGAAVIPWGGGTRMGIGFPPRAADLVVRTERFQDVVEYEPADLTVTVQAGMRLGDLQGRLRAEGQMLALDPAASDRATIGGLIATNASGPLRLLYGSARDLVIGTRVVNADGVVSKAGGRVVKNVAGYDLNKLYVGSLGTVGVIVELGFKLHPLPQAEGMLLAAFDSVDDAAAVISSLVRSPLGPAAIELLDAGGATSLNAGVTLSSDQVVLIVAATGFEKAVVRQLGDMTAMSAKAATISTVRAGTELDGLWSALRELADPSAAGVALLKLAVPPSRSAVALKTARDAAREAGFTPATQAHAGSGVVYLKLQSGSWDAGWLGRLDALVTRLRTFVRSEGGSLVLEAVPDGATASQGGIDPWGDVGTGFPVMQALKQNLDPKGTLNPGRFVGRL